jgi:molybdopterin/thiamine biosynthesis adenylyltransferase
VHWWQTQGGLLEREQAWFRQAGLPFELDQTTLDRHGVVIFTGELRYGDQGIGARVIYPAGYLGGHHPAVVAPGLPIDRHKGPDNSLCLDHAVDGAAHPMCGAEAVQRAQELWKLTIEDPAGLQAAEAPAPDPRIGFYDYEPGSAVIMADIDVDGIDGGYLRVGASSSHPLRGSVIGLGTGPQFETAIAVPATNTVLSGSVPVAGLWRRLPQRPGGADAATVTAWITANHRDLLDQAQAIALAERQRRRQQLPALVGFVFPDEITQGVYGDVWMIYTLEHDGTARLCRTYPIGEQERWTRQPQLEPLAGRSVAVLGNGALGAPFATHLARAGTGSFLLVDPDIITPGNRVRHDSDLGDLGWPKVTALRRRILRINPYAQVGIAAIRYGAAISGDISVEQPMHDEITTALGNQDLIVNATAHIATGYYLSTIADDARRPILHVMVSSGAWSGRILLQHHGHSGCLECLAHHQANPNADSPADLDWTEDPDLPTVADGGCAQSTFTGPGFDIAETAAAAARLAVQTLLDGDGYPRCDHDMITLRWREGDRGVPLATYQRLPRHPDCTSCSP